MPTVDGTGSVGKQHVLDANTTARGIVDTHPANPCGYFANFVPDYISNGAVVPEEKKMAQYPGPKHTKVCLLPLWQERRVTNRMHTGLLSMDSCERKLLAHITLSLDISQDCCREEEEEEGIEFFLPHGGHDGRFDGVPGHPLHLVSVVRERRRALLRRNVPHLYTRGTAKTTISTTTTTTTTADINNINNDVRYCLGLRSWVRKERRRGDEGCLRTYEDGQHSSDKIRIGRLKTTTQSKHSNQSSGERSSTAWQAAPRVATKRAAKL